MGALAQMREDLRPAHILRAHRAMEPRDGALEDAHPRLAPERLRDLVRERELAAEGEGAREGGEVRELVFEGVRVDVRGEPGLDVCAERGQLRDVREARAVFERACAHVVGVEAEQVLAVCLPEELQTADGGVSPLLRKLGLLVFVHDLDDRVAYVSPL